MDLNQWKIGITLERLRRGKQFSQEELGFQSSLDRKTISNLENNQQEPSFPTVVALAEALEMLPSDFVKEIEKDVLG
ncbi:helix-turn-helix domain-containing protein [Bacillus niameyensis]|uniref:helix-turn-helix domain-containing protein n=1 Tax=Bacillus niameyensis TaxID=1522308 RepID=UPI0007857C58|nr:helix-turn-helix transcriptional regulator [Bacillus niameyensis]